MIAQTDSQDSLKPKASSIQVRNFSSQPLKILAASLASVSITAVCCTPLDVMKVRMQNNHTIEVAGASGQNIKTVRNSQMLSSLGTLRYIVKNEGIATLFNGLKKSIVLAGLGAGTYWPIYEYFKQELSVYTKNKILLPLGASLMARCVSISLVFPLEYLRTVEQGSKGFQNIKLRSLLEKRPVGFLVTLQRELMFSGSYWVFAENIRSYMNSKESSTFGKKTRIFMTNLFTGAVSGAISCFISTPLDVVKTRLQLNPEYYGHMNQFKIMKKIVSEEGASTLLTGVGPRVLKGMFACALMLGFYEVIMDTL